MLAPVIRSLIVAPQWIGDAVMSQPLLARLAARGEALTVGALPWVAPVYRAMPEVGEVLEWPFAHRRLDLGLRRRLALGLRGRFERAYLLPNSLKAALLPWWARIPERIGYVGEGRRPLLHRALPNPGGRPPMVAFYAALAGAAGTFEASDVAETLEAPRLALPSPVVDAALAAAGLRRGGYWALAPGAEYGPAKRWPAAHVAALVRALGAAARPLPVVLLGSAAERAACESIAAAAAPDGAGGADCRVLAGALPLSDAIALVGAARGVVTNDSGLMHVAAAFGVPQVAIFGSTDPRHTPPSNPNARVLWLKDELGLDCMPCFERSCRYGHTGCLAGIAPARVEAALADAVARVRTIDRRAAVDPAGQVDSLPT